MTRLLADSRAGDRIPTVCQRLWLCEQLLWRTCILSSLSCLQLTGLSKAGGQGEVSVRLCM